MEGWFGAEASSILTGESSDWRIAKKVQNLPVVDENFKQEVIKEGTVKSFDGDSNMFIIEPSPPREGKKFRAHRDDVERVLARPGRIPPLTLKFAANSILASTFATFPRTIEIQAEDEIMRALEEGIPKVHAHVRPGPK